MKYEETCCGRHMALNFSCRAVKDIEFINGADLDLRHTHYTTQAQVFCWDGDGL